MQRAGILVMLEGPMEQLAHEGRALERDVFLLRRFIQLLDELFIFPEPNSNFLLLNRLHLTRPGLGISFLVLVAHRSLPQSAVR